MAWWSWVLIWGVLLLGLLAMLVLLLWRLFRKGLLVLEELSALLARSGELDAAADALAGARVDEEFEPAVLQKRAEVATLRAELVRLRARRKEAHRKVRVRRGKVLVSTDATQRTWF